VTIRAVNRTWHTPILEIDVVVEKAKNGDITAFEELYTLYKAPVYSLCLRLSKDVRDAEDLTQEVFLQLHRKVRSFRGEAAFSSWLYRVATNVAMMHLRKRHREELPLDILEYESRPLASASQPGSGHHCHPVEHIALWKALSGLSKRRRTLVLLHDLRGLTHGEIAERLGVAVNTSRTEVYQAHRKLRDLLTGRGLPTQQRFTASCSSASSCPGAPR
jgi:RNA polymerase sigma-70 factor (ECF subfamily)